MPRKCPEKQLAIANNELYYFTGKSCKRGHISKCLVSTNQCYECALIHSKAWKQQNPEYVKEYSKQWLASLSPEELEIHKQQVSKRACQWVKDNPERHKINMTNSMAKPENKQRKIQYGNEWKKENRDKCRIQEQRAYTKNPAKFHAKNAKRHAQKLSATPR